MGKRALSGVGIFLGLCLSIPAQQTERADAFRALNNSAVQTPSLALSDAHLFLFPTGFAWTQPARSDFLPTLPAAPQPQRAGNTSFAMSAKDSSKEIANNLSPGNLFDYVHGEVGFLYGRSTGKFNREVESGCIIGETGNDKFQIMVGASYENVSGRFPTFGTLKR
jgi:hypothetical protein